MTTTNTAKQLANRVARLEGALNHPMAGTTGLERVLRQLIHQCDTLGDQALVDKERLDALERNQQTSVMGVYNERLEALERDASQWKKIACEPVVRVMPRDELIEYVKLHYTKHTRLYILQQLLGDLT